MNGGKRIVKSINSMCTELLLPLARKVSLKCAILLLSLHNMTPMINVVEKEGNTCAHE